MKDTITVIIIYILLLMNGVVDHLQTNEIKEIKKDLIK